MVGWAPNRDSSKIGTRWCSKDSAIMIDVCRGLTSTWVGKRSMESDIIGKRLKESEADVVWSSINKRKKVGACMQPWGTTALKENGRSKTLSTRVETVGLWHSGYESYMEPERRPIRQQTFVPDSNEGLGDAQVNQMIFSAVIQCSRPGKWDEN